LNFKFIHEYLNFPANLPRFFSFFKKNTKGNLIRQPMDENEEIYKLTA